MPTLQDLFDRAKTRAGRLARRRDNPKLALSDEDDPVLQDFAKEVAVEIAQETGRIRARAEISVSAGQAEYQVPTSVGRVLKLVWSASGATGGKELKHSSGHDVRAEAEQQLNSGAQGAPTAYGFHNGSLWLDAPPAQGGTLRMYYIAESLIGEEDSSFTSDETPAGDLSDHLPPELEEPFIKGLLIRHFREVGALQLAELYDQDYWEKLGNVSRKPRNQRTTTRPNRWLA